MIAQDWWTLVIAVVVIIAAVALIMSGWRRRASTQTGVWEELPARPADPGEPELPPLQGIYVGSTYAGYWQERIARPPLGYRSAATLTAYPEGIELVLADDVVWIPRSALHHVRQDSKLAGKVVPGGGLLVVRWTVSGPDGDTDIDSGFRADSKDDYPRWTTVTGSYDAGGTDSADGAGTTDLSDNAGHAGNEEQQ